jgi:hypothetical protein
MARNSFDILLHVPSSPGYVAWPIFILVRQPGDYFIYYASIAGAAILNIIWNVTKASERIGRKIVQEWLAAAYPQNMGYIFH